MRSLIYRKLTLCNFLFAASCFTFKIAINCDFQTFYSTATSRMTGWTIVKRIEWWHHGSTMTPQHYRHSLIHANCNGIHTHPEEKHSLNSHHSLSQTLQDTHWRSNPYLLRTIFLNYLVYEINHATRRTDNALLIHNTLRHQHVYSKHHRQSWQIITVKIFDTSFYPSDLYISPFKLISCSLPP